MPKSFCDANTLSMPSWLCWYKRPCHAAPRFELASSHCHPSLLVVSFRNRLLTTHDFIPRECIILVLWPRDGIDVKDGFQRLAHAHNDDELEECLSYPPHQRLPLFGCLAFGSLDEFLVEQRREARLPAAYHRRELQWLSRCSHLCMQDMPYQKNIPLVISK